MGKNQKKKGGKGKQEAGEDKLDLLQTQDESSESPSEQFEDIPEDIYEQRAIKDNLEGTKYVRDEPTTKINQDEDIKRLEED